MVGHPVVELLTKQSRARLREMDTQITAQIEDLRVQSAWIKRALAEKGEGDDTTGGVPAVAAKRRRGQTREAIMSVIVADPERVWLPNEVRKGLLERGIDMKVEALRVALRRMGDDNELVRGPDGNGWKLASTNGAVQSSLDEASTLESERDGR